MTTEEAYGYILKHKGILTKRERAKLREMAINDPEEAFMRTLVRAEQKWRELERTQCEMILHYMRENGSITAWEAMKEIGCMRLGSRICDLRRAGHKITTNSETRKNRWGVQTTYARYTLAEGAENG